MAYQSPGQCRTWKNEGWSIPESHHFNFFGPPYYLLHPQAFWSVKQHMLKNTWQIGWYKGSQRSCHDYLSFRSFRVLVSMSGESVFFTQEAKWHTSAFLLLSVSSRVCKNPAENTVQSVHRATKSSRMWIGARPQSLPTTISRWVGKPPLGWPATEEPACRTGTWSKLQWFCMCIYDANLL